MKALFIGLGGIGQRHLRNLVALTGGKIELLAYRVRRNTQMLTDQLAIAPGKNLESEFGFKVFADLQSALERKPDIAFICNPSSLHIPIALEAARAGCHLFIEKPVSHSADGMDELIELVKRQKLAALVGYQLRFHPLLKRIKTLLDNNAIARVVAVRMEVGESVEKWHPYEDYRQMYAARSDLGGGVVLSQIHEMDYAYWLFGLPERVFAIGGHLSKLQVDVEDVASILMQCRVAGQAIPVHLHQDYLQFPPSRGCQIIGDAGKIVLDLRTVSLTVYGATGEVIETQTIENFQRNQMFLDEMSHFLACVKGEQRPVVSLADGLQSLRMALAAKESLASGKVVSLIPPQT